MGSEEAEEEGEREEEYLLYANAKLPHGNCSHPQVSTSTPSDAPLLSTPATKTVNSVSEGSREERGEKRK